MRISWRPRLRTRITIALVAVAVGIAATTAGALIWNARSIILESRQAAIYEMLRIEARAAVEQLPDHPGEHELRLVSESISGPALLVNLETGEHGGSMPIDDVPDYLVDSLQQRFMETAYERSTRLNRLVFTAGVTVSTADGDGDRIAVFGSFDMQQQQDEIDELLTLGISIGVGFVGLAALVGVIVGRQLGRPLQTLAEVADALGSSTSEAPGPTATGYPDVDAVLAAMRGSEARLHETIGQLKESEATAQRLVADVAHELRTPLATLVAVADILADTESASAENRREAGEIAAKSATHLTSLTNDILELSRFDSGKSEIRSQRVDIAELWRELAEARGWQDVDFVLDSGVSDATVDTDVVRLRLIITNLVTNALRHGEPPVSVRVWIRDGKLTCTVSDRGTGIPPEHAGRVFNRFYQASTSRSDGESSGLGLAIVRENARLLGGEAWIEPGATTTFAFWVPATR